MRTRSQWKVTGEVVGDHSVVESGAARCPVGVSDVVKELRMDDLWGREISSGSVTLEICKSLMSYVKALRYVKNMRLVDWKASAYRCTSIRVSTEV